MDEQEIVKNKNLYQSGTDTDTISQHKKKHKFSIFSKQFLKAKIVFCNANANADSNTMLIPRCQCRHFQMTIRHDTLNDTP